MIAPISGTAVFHVRLTPVCEKIQLVNSGFRWWDSACGIQARNHMNCLGSCPTPTYAAVGSGQNPENSASARIAYAAAAARCRPMLASGANGLGRAANSRKTMEIGFTAPATADPPWAAGTEMDRGSAN